MTKDMMIFLEAKLSETDCDSISDPDDNIFGQTLQDTPASVRSCVCPPVNIFKHLLWNQEAN